jgi:phage tail protein X
VTPLAKATLTAQYSSGALAIFEVQYNPTEFALDKGVQLAEIAIPGLDSPLLQFVRGQNEKLSIDLFFDTTDDGTGARATSVTTKTDPIYSLVKIEPAGHAPPIVTFAWNSAFPGADLPAASGNQRRTAFRGVVESCRQKFTFFSPEGVPLRAILTLSLREYKTLEEQLAQLNLSSPDRTHAYLTRDGDTLSRIAGRYYGRAGAWRSVAEANDIDDPRRLNPGVLLTIPSIR